MDVEIRNIYDPLQYSKDSIEKNKIMNKYGSGTTPFI